MHSGLKFLRFALALTPALAATPALAVNLRVLVARAPQLTVQLPTTPPAPGTAPSLPPTSPALPTQSWQVGVRGNTLTLNGQDAGNNLLYLTPQPGSTVRIAGKLYRGGLLLKADQGYVQGINVVDVEDYLRGVVPSEMPASWPLEALGAQAIIARTYATSRISPAAPYDTCATEQCQVYNGISAEKESTDAAIRATAGRVVAYNNKAASTFFSSDSGGFTASSGEVWGNDLPYLPAKADPFSLGGPREHWRLQVPLGKVTDVAARYGVRIGTLRDVRVTKLSASGRAQEITLTGSAGTRKISGAQAGGFVRSLGASSSRAGLSGPVSSSRPLVVEGYGSGHGVGLSQYGALGMAQRGYDHLHILGFYYPGTVLSHLAGVRERALVAGGTPLPVRLAPPSLFATGRTHFD